MASEIYANLFFDDEKIRITVLTNICRMLVNRGYMDIRKYGTKTKTNANSDRGFKVEQPADDHINNTEFLPFIEKRHDNNTYMIPLDTPYRDQRKSDGLVEFDGSQVVVRLIPQVVKDITNSSILNDFFKTYRKNHKIIVFDGMAKKVEMVLSKKNNVEVFDRDFFMIDLMSHDHAPVSCKIATLDEMNHVINPKVGKIHENDPLNKYYNGKKGQILSIVRPSLNNSIEAGFRKIIEAKPLFE
jgi:DNA-directed RNA polymerase subunit H (RpoH/RPB5)